MKITLLGFFLTIAIFSPNVTFCQEIGFGFQGGIILSDIKVHSTPINKNSDGYLPAVSFNLNSNITYKSGTFWGISAEPGFIQKGVRFELDPDARLKLNYIYIPVLANFYVKDKFFFSSGPEFSFLINAKTEQDITKLFENYRFELSGTAGIGYSISNRINICFRYNHAFTRFWKHTDLTLSGEIEFKEYNQYYQLMVQYKLKHN